MKLFILIFCSVAFLIFYVPWWLYQRNLTKFRAGLKLDSRVKYLMNKQPRQGRVTRVFNGGLFGIKDAATGAKRLVSIREIYPMIGGKKKGGAK
jgi:hypothetical protein